MKLRRLGIVMVLTGAAWAQRQPLMDANGYVRDDAYARMALPASEQKYAKIDGLKMKDTVNEVVAISLKSRDDGNKYWGRIAGTKYEAMTRDLLESKFKKFGLTDIHTQEFPLPPQWFATDWNYTFTAGGKSYTFPSINPSVGTVGTAAAGLDLEMVWVGEGTEADFAGREVKGKAVLIHAIPAPGSMGNSALYNGAIRRSVEKGAGAIGVIYGISDNWAIWQGLGNSGVIDPRITIPGFFMGYKDGKTLRDLIGSGQTVKVHMQVDIERREGLKSMSIFGTLPGTTDENILVMAHMDGWYQAALDNASGLSTMLAIAEYFSQVPQSQRRRSITFIGTAGHHTGSPGSRYLHEHKDTALAKTVFAINCEHVSVSDTKYWQETLRKANVAAPRRWWVNGSDKVLDIVLKSYATFGIGLIADMDPNSSGEMGIMARDVPSIQIIRSPVNKHTDDDVPAWVPSSGLEATARAYSKIIDEVNKLDRKDILPQAPAPATTAVR